MKSVVLGDARRDTCNFQVADTHTYFVGTLNAWVHNACDPGDILQAGGRPLGDDTLISIHGDKLVKGSDGTYENVGPASAQEIIDSEVVVEPRPTPSASIGFTSDTVDTAFSGMREGHAIRHLQGILNPG